LECAKFVKVVDTTPIEAMPADGDGFDLNTIQALQDCYDCTIYDETAWGAGTRFTPKGNWATYFLYTVEEVVEPCNLEGVWDVELFLNGVEYDRFFIIADQDGDEITGGFGVTYPNITGPIEGTVTGLSIYFVYDPPGDYWAEFFGTIAEDCNSMSGDWEHYNSGIPGLYWDQTWVATRVIP